MTLCWHWGVRLQSRFEKLYLLCLADKGRIDIDGACWLLSLTSRHEDVRRAFHENALYTCTSIACKPGRQSTTYLECGVSLLGILSVCAPDAVHAQPSVCRFGLNVMRPGGPDYELTPELAVWVRELRTFGFPF